MAHTEHTALIGQLTDLLRKGHAHVTLEDALAGIPQHHRGRIPEGAPYSIWQLLEHIRISQWDILDFSRNPDYKEISWPADYWPKESAPESEDAWQHAIQQLFSDREAFIELLYRKDADLFTPFPWGSGQNLLREAMLIADHNSYHTGQIIIIRRLLGDWK